MIGNAGVVLLLGATVCPELALQIYCISHRRSLVCFSSRRSAEGKRKFSQVNDLVACFWVIFGSRPEVLELAQSLNSYFLECYIWSCGFHQDVFMGRWCAWPFSVPRLLNTNWPNSFRFTETPLEEGRSLKILHFVDKIMRKAAL